MDPSQSGRWQGLHARSGRDGDDTRGGEQGVDDRGVHVGGLPLPSTAGPSGDGIGDGGRLSLSSSVRET